MAFTFGESDLAELNRLLKTSQRPNVQKFLQKEISRLSALESQQKTNIQGLNLSAQLSRGESKSANNAGVVKKTKAAPPKKPTKPPAAIPGTSRWMIYIRYVSFVFLFFIGLVRRRSATNPTTTFLAHFSFLIFLFHNNVLFSNLHIIIIIINQVPSTLSLPRSVGIKRVIG